MKWWTVISLIRHRSFLNHQLPAQPFPSPLLRDKLWPKDYHIYIHTHNHDAITRFVGRQSILCFLSSQFTDRQTKMQVFPSSGVMSFKVVSTASWLFVQKVFRFFFWSTWKNWKTTTRAVSASSPASEQQWGHVAAAAAGALDCLFLREASSAIKRLTESSRTAGDDAVVGSQNLRWDLCLTMYLRKQHNKSCQTFDFWWRLVSNLTKTLYSTADGWRWRWSRTGRHTCRGFPRSAGRRAGPDGAGGGSAPGQSRPTSERWGPSLPRRTSSEKLGLAEWTSTQV